MIGVTKENRVNEWLLLVVLIVFFVLVTYLASDKKMDLLPPTPEQVCLETVNHKMDSILYLLVEFYVRDTLYRKHLQECSFISKKQLFVDKYGYLRVK